MYDTAPGPTERATTSAYEMFERVDEAKHPCEVMIGDMNQDDLRELDNMIGLFTWVEIFPLVFSPTKYLYWRSLAHSQ